jgi:hypothetical protein
MNRTFRRWLCWFLFLFVLDFTIPFFLLKDVPTITGSFLFWVIWILMAIGSMFVIFLQWRDDPELIEGDRS